MAPGDLKAIQADYAGQPDSQKRCFNEVFEKWYNGLTSDYTWKKVAEALVSRDVDSKWLLEVLYKKLAVTSN